MSRVSFNIVLPIEKPELELERSESPGSGKAAAAELYLLTGATMTVPGQMPEPGPPVTSPRPIAAALAASADPCYNRLGAVHGGRSTHTSERSLFPEITLNIARGINNIAYIIDSKYFLNLNRDYLPRFSRASSQADPSGCQYYV